MVETRAGSSTPPPISAPTRHLGAAAVAPGAAAPRWAAVLLAVGRLLPVLDPASRLEVPLVSDPWLSADDIAVHLGVTKDTVYAWIAEKGMPAHKVDWLWRFQASEVDEWVRNGSGALSGEASCASDGA